MKNSAPNPSERNREWTRIDANSRRLSCPGFCSRSFAFIRGSIRFACGLAAVVFVAIAFTLRAPAAESPSVLLQKGIFAEETEGNVDAAIKIYEQITTEAATNRSVVAQAQYRLAVCYQKKGDKPQAIKLLNELVQQFSSDVEVSRKARATLVELGQSPAEGISVRRVPLPFLSPWFMSISPDGRLIAYDPYEKNGISVCELATGKTWTIFKRDQETFNGAIFSPDGQWLAYDLNDSAIYVSKVDGSGTRKLYQSDGKEGVLSVALWSPDGSEVIVESSIKNSPPRGFSLNLITSARKELDVPTQNMTPPPDDHEQDSWAFSWSGQYLARRVGNYPQRISIWDSKTGREEFVVNEGADRVFGWAPGDSKLLFSKVRAGGIDLWAVNIKDGKPSGEPELIWNHLGLGIFIPLGITRDGNIYYAVWKANHEPKELWVMEGLLTKKPAGEKTAIAQNSVETPPDEILAPDHSILDRKFGLSLTYPEGWTIDHAARFLKQTGSYIWFIAPEVPEAYPRLYYIPAKSTGEFPSGTIASDLSALGPKPTTFADIDAWLHKYAQLKTESRQRGTNFKNYRLRPASFVSRTINGRPALSWLSDFDVKDGKNWLEYHVVVYSENLVAQFFLTAPIEKMDAIRPTFDRMADTTHLP